MFKFQEVVATALTFFILYSIFIPFKTSYNQDLDTIKSYYLIAFAAIVAIFFHSNLNRSLFADYGWAFTQYLETIAILSQFVLFTKKVLLDDYSGWINLDLYITFRGFPGHFSNPFDYLLDLDLH